MSFFLLSKLAWYAIEPSHLLVWTMAAAAVLCCRRQRAGAVLASLCALALWVLLTVPVGNWALRPLENSYARPAWPDHVDGILVLGEGLNAEVLADRGVPGVGPDGGVLLAAAILARRYPEARLVFAGGSGEPGGGLPEAQVAAHLFDGLGLSPLIEDRSRTSWENLVNAKALVHPRAGETWLLVAGALHLPRALAVADQLGWALTPWPADYLTTRNGPEAHLSLADNLAHLDKAAHEALGLLAYRLTGKGA
ncbi:MAG TPA: YdcF family protein [Magnetospirillaceae bacterium]|nr:YdcF family protein [Magnetospirillaceae bacterium]